MNTHTCEFCKHSYKSQRQLTTHYDKTINNNDHIIFLEKMDLNDIVIDDSSSSKSFVDSYRSRE